MLTCQSWACSLHMVGFRRGRLLAHVTRSEEGICILIPLRPPRPNQLSRIIREEYPETQCT